MRGQRLDFEGFNEAAGIPRGRLDRLEDVVRLRDLASMRPRVFPAEDISAGEPEPWIVELQ